MYLLFDFSTILSNTTTFIGTSLALVDPSTFIGGLVTASLVGMVMVSLAKRVITLVKR